MPTDRQALEQLKIDRPAAPSRGPYLVLFGIAVAVLLLAGAIAWWWTRPKPVSVRTAAAREIAAGGSTTLLNASGYVTARRQATVSSKVTGRVVDVLIEEGMKVEEGQVLSHIDATNVEASLRLAEAQLETAKWAASETRNNLEEAERTLRRTEALAEAKTVSDSELDRARTEAGALRARCAQQESSIVVAERQVALWQQQLDDTVIRAPFAGVVTSKNAQPGEMISPISAGGGFTRTGICTIVDMGSLEVEVDVNESYINRVAADQPVVVTLDSYPDWRIPAKVIAIVPTADRQKATVRVRVAFVQLDPRVLPDMGLKVAFQGDEKTAPAVNRVVVVPKTAVRRLDGRDIAWVVDNGRAERRAVTVSLTTGDETTLAAGVAGGERVIIESPAELTESALVSETKS